MAVIVKEPDRSTTEFLTYFLNGSIYGNCYPFAIALHRGLGWRIVGILDGANIIHAGVRSPEGKLFDGRGEVTEEEFPEPFENRVPYVISDITEEMLLASGTVDERLVEFFHGKAQSVWPDLPWKQTSYQERVVAFAKDLEEISRKHKLWISGPVPAMLPVIFEGYDDETGYEISLTGDGNTFTINRMIDEGK